MRSAAADFDELLVELAWSLWTELGVRGVTRAHQDWSVDPEALIILTAGVSAADPRLRDEALDWCISFERHISRSRLKSLLKRADPTWLDSFGTLSATFSRFGRQSWPSPGDPLPFEPSGKSSPPQLTRPALIRLRVRAIFGVSARAELLHALLPQERGEQSAADLSNLIAYSKRTILDELDGLEAAGVIESRLHLNRRLYRLREPKTFKAFAGPAPRHFPDWAGLVEVAGSLSALFRAAPRAGVVADVEANRVLSGIGEVGGALGPVPTPPPGPDSYERTREWALSVFGGLAAGRAR